MNSHDKARHRERVLKAQSERPEICNHALSQNNENVPMAATLMLGLSLPMIGLEVLNMTLSAGSVIENFARSLGGIDTFMSRVSHAILILMTVLIASLPLRALSHRYIFKGSSASEYVKKVTRGGITMGVLISAMIISMGMWAIIPIAFLFVMILFKAGAMMED